MSRKFNELREKMSPERRAKSKLMAQEMMAHADPITLTLPYPPKEPTNGRWSKSDDSILRRHHGEASIQELMRVTGRTYSSVVQRRYVLGLKNTKPPAWDQSEIDILVDEYERAGCEWPNLDDVAKKIGRHKTNVCRKARELGLTDYNRTKPNRKVRHPKYGSMEGFRKMLPELARRQIKKYGHPRGFLGQSHSESARFKISMASRTRAENMTDEEKSRRVMKALKTKKKRYGTINPSGRRASWKAGWREIKDKRIYARSRWEANVGRYLQFLKERGEIEDWQHEPDTFWFDAIKRGVRSYLPDFKVFPADGSEAYYIEVKGWMCQRSKTALKRMKKYHPHIKIELIQEKRYNGLCRTVGPLIDGWE